MGHIPSPTIMLICHLLLSPYHKHVKDHLVLKVWSHISSPTIVLIYHLLLLSYHRHCKGHNFVLKLLRLSSQPVHLTLAQRAWRQKLWKQLGASAWTPKEYLCIVYLYTYIYIYIYLYVCRIWPCGKGVGQLFYVLLGSR